MLLYMDFMVLENQILRTCYKNKIKMLLFMKNMLY